MSAGVTNRVPWHWYPDMETEESRRAVRELLARRGVPDPHDPEFLFCLDKVDIISRYQLMLMESERRKESDRQHHDSEIQRLRKTVESAAKWWNHCLQLRHQKRKTVNLADMEVSS